MGPRLQKVVNLLTFWLVSIPLEQRKKNKRQDKLWDTEPS